MSPPRASSAPRLRPAVLVASAVGALLLACGARRTPAPGPTPFTGRGGDADGRSAGYATVQVLHLQAGGVPRFVAARKRWLDVLARGSVSDGRGLFLQMGDSGFLSLRPARSLGDLDRQPALAAAALVGVDPDELRRYDEGTRALLAPPHRTEIWKLDTDLGFGAADPVAALVGAAWGKMTVEEIDPTPAGDDYLRVWREVRAALLVAGYPLVRVSYWSAYGTGNLVTFWLANSQREFLATEPVDAAVARVLGEDDAKALVARRARVVLASESVDVIPRLDLSSKVL